MSIRSNGEADSNGDSDTDVQNSGITANNLSRKLKEYQLTLEKSHNIKVSFERKNSARLIILSKVTGDTDFTVPLLSQMSVEDCTAADVVTMAENAVTTPPLSDSTPQEDAPIKPPSPVTGKPKD